MIKLSFQKGSVGQEFLNNNFSISLKAFGIQKILLKYGKYKQYE